VNGAAIPLSAITRFEMKSSPLSVNHQGQFPVVTISFNLAPNASLGEATKAIDKAQREINMPLSVQGPFRAPPLRFKLPCRTNRY
jgi:multidrug efflux pump